MVSLQDFLPNYPRPGEVVVCEQDGRLCSLPVSQLNASAFEHRIQSDSTLDKTASYPDINISRELCHHAANATATYSHDVMIPVNETLIKRISRTFFESGFVQAVKEATQAGNVDEETNSVVGFLAKYTLLLIELNDRVQLYLRPHSKEQGVFSIAKFSQTRDWPRSLIRYIKWHPNCFKIAVAACDDSIRIYTDEQTVVQILKSHFQKCITSLAWRPYAAGELAVGCENGALVWQLDPNSHITRPLSQTVHLKHAKHFPVTSLQWSQNGNLLATASINDSDILIWDVDQNTSTPLKRVGPPCALLLWSPDGRRLCTTTVGSVFRVWNTDKWIPERWTVAHGAIKSAAWSPCGGYLLFVTTDEPMLYSLRFVDQQLFAASSVPKEALPVADLSKISVGTTDVGGRPQCLAWDPRGRYLAVTFKDTAAVAIFLTSIKRHLLSIAPNGFLVGIGAEVPAHIDFQEKHRNQTDTTVLTIGWSSGRVQYFPYD